MLERFLRTRQVCLAMLDLVVFVHVRMEVWENRRIEWMEKMEWKYRRIEFHGEGQFKVDLVIAEPRETLYQEEGALII